MADPTFSASVVPKQSGQRVGKWPRRRNAINGVTYGHAVPSRPWLESIRVPRGVARGMLYFQRLNAVKTGGASCPEGET